MFFNCKWQLVQHLIWSSTENRKEATSDTYFRRSRCFQSTANSDDTYTCIQKPYLLWIRDPHTLKFLHVLKIHNIAHNIKCDTYQHDILQVLLGVIAYVQRRMEENRQEHHQEGEHRVGTAKMKMGGMSRNVMEKTRRWRVGVQCMVVYG